MDSGFVIGIVSPHGVAPADPCFLVRDRDVLVAGGDDASVAVPCQGQLPGLDLASVDLLYLGHSPRFGHCHAAALPAGVAPPAGTQWRGLRQLYGLLDDELLGIAGRAVQIVDWDRDHRFCGRCGSPTERRRTERARECPRCHQLFFPRLAPAVIVLVHRGEEFLLARNHRFPPGRYSLLAGFVEPGESVEEAVHREVREEVGLRLADLRYWGSQPWPFPHSLMLGFTAAYAGGQLGLADGELADARWFSRDRARLPELPDSMSISRRLIEHFLSGGCGK